MKKRLAKVLLLGVPVILTLLLAGCSGSSGSETTASAATSPPPVTPISGVASKGPLVSCEIKGFILEPDGSRGRQVVGAPVTNPSITQAPDGSWNATIPSDEPGPFIIEASGAQCTYFDEATGQQQSIGNAAILGLLPSGETTAAITPLTHALVLVVQDALAAAASGGMTDIAVLVNNVITNATETFGFDPVRTLSPDPRNLPEANAATSDQLEYATILGGLSQILQATPSADIAAELLILAQDLTNGALDGTTALQGMPTPPINILQEARAAGLQGESLQEVATNFASTPPDVAELDQAGFRQAALVAPVTIGTPPPGGFVATPEAALTPTVEAVNTSPVPTAPALVTTQDTTGTSQVAPNDPDAGQVHIFRVTIAPANGTATVDDTGLVHYTPKTNFFGTDSLAVAVVDNGSPRLSGTVTIGITVTAVNDPPVAADDTASTPEDTAVVIDVVANDNDPDGDPLSVVTTTQGTQGAVTLNTDGTVTYTPMPNFSGNDTFTYTISDPSGATDTATVTVEVEAVDNQVDLEITVMDVTTQLPLDAAVVSVDGNSGTTSANGSVTFANVTVGTIAITVTQSDYVAHSFVRANHLNTTGLNLFLYPNREETADIDGDGLPDDVETNTGIFLTALNTGTDASNADTDGDGLNDGVEILVEEVR